MKKFFFLLISCIVYPLNPVFAMYPLHEAAQTGDVKRARSLLSSESASCINEKDDDGRTPLHVAVLCCHDEIVHILLHANADPNLRNILGNTPLDQAIVFGHAKLVKTFLNTKIDPNAPDKYGWVLLHEAACQSNAEITQMLLNARAKPNVQDDYGNTPLHIAIQWHNTEVVHTLLNNGANPNTKDNNDDTPLHIAAKWNRVRAMQLLVIAGARVDATNKYGQTPVDIACLNENYKFTVEIRKLIKAMCQINCCQLAFLAQMLCKKSNYILNYHEPIMPKLQYSTALTMDVIQHICSYVRPSVFTYDYQLLEKYNNMYDELKKQRDINNLLL